MRRVEVEASDDAGHAEGGRAILLLCGVDAVPDDAAFFLRPLDKEPGTDSSGALEGEQWPLSVRLVERGLELVLGPEVTEQPALKAGAAVEIEMPDAAVWSEFTWPTLTPRVRPKRKSILVGRTSSGGSVPAASGAQPTANVGAGGGAPVAEPAPRPRLDPPIAAAPFTAPPTAAEFSTQDGTAMATPSPTTGAPAVAAELNHDPAQGGDYVVFYPHARGGKLGPATSSGGRRASSLLPTTRIGAAVMAAAAVLAAQAAIWLGTGGQLAQVPAGAALAGKGSSEISNFDLLTAATVSPRGVSARETTAIKALENAQAALLTPGTPRDSEEAAFWLRRYLGAGGPDERTRRALTQLGSTYADSTNREVDFVKARQIWEVASAFGDPVSMCFLGTLHENGLATAVDRKVALAWFERGKQAGGCPAVDDAIARLRQ